jgi:hypothetical protein
MTTPPDPSLPLPLVAASDEETKAHVFPNGAQPDVHTPVGVAFLWWSALLSVEKLSDIMPALCVDAADWGDWTGTRGLLDGWGMLQHPEMSSERPGLAYVRFIPYSGGTSARAFAEAELTDVQFLTVVEAEGRWWVWGLSRNQRPSAQDVGFPH